VSQRHAGRGFVVIYRWHVAPEVEDAFRIDWHEITLTLRELGGLGSCLTRADDGEFVAIALWRSAEARSSAFAHLDSSPRAGVTRVSAWELAVEDDLWLQSAFDLPRDR
jgi:hypothetical protein